MPQGIADLPGFAESLRLLIESHQYSLTDVAMMFNVSRERIRQLCARYRVQYQPYSSATGLNAMRIWDDTDNQFRPFQLKLVRETIHSETQAQRLYDRQHTITQRRIAISECYHTLRRELGTEPTVQQWVERLRGKPTKQLAAGPFLVNHWGLDGGPVRGTLARIRHTIGAPPGKPGGRKHPKTATDIPHDRVPNA